MVRGVRSHCKHVLVFCSVSRTRTSFWYKFRRFCPIKVQSVTGTLTASTLIYPLSLTKFMFQIAIGAKQNKVKFVLFIISCVLTLSLTFILRFLLGEYSQINISLSLCKVGRTNLHYRSILRWIKPQKYF